MAKNAPKCTMTKKMWLASNIPTAMLRAASTTMSGRQRRLFAAACCRQIWDLITDPQLRDAIEIAEMATDERTTASELREAAVKVEVVRRKLEPKCSRATFYAIWAVASTVGVPDSAANLAATARSYELLEGMSPSRAAEVPWAQIAPLSRVQSAAMCDLLRDICDPFATMRFDPAWRTDNIRGLADTFYQDRNFDIMPILADALMDVGCDNKELIEHCQSPTPHARGCWVVDLILGRS